MSAAATHHDLGAAITKLMSLHDGDVGVIETIACGAAAIPALHSILLSRDRAGIFETRRRAVEALEGLKAFDVLRDYLAAPNETDDPVERTGEDAVINAAARALGRLGDTRDMPRLFALLRSRPLAGVIEATSRFRQISTVPAFIQALGDDFTRSAAESAIRKFGVKARGLLLQAALARVPQTGQEAGASISRRRSALKLLQAVPTPPGTLPPAFDAVTRDDDPWIALWACRLSLACFDRAHQRDAIDRLLTMLTSADELLAAEVEDCLVEHYDLARDMIETTERRHVEPPVPIWRSHDYTDRVFERVRKRISTNTGMEGPPV
jgi:HEAT repeat protein